jgi:hypothetical protein
MRFNPSVPVSSLGFIYNFLRDGTKDEDEDDETGDKDKDEDVLPPLDFDEFK